MLNNEKRLRHHHLNKCHLHLHMEVCKKTMDLLVIGKFVVYIHNFKNTFQLNLSYKFHITLSGPGHLGARVATLWKQKFSDAKVALKARNVDSEREAKWKSLGFVAYQEGDKYNNVLFAVPPSGQFRKKGRVILRKKRPFSLLSIRTPILLDVKDAL